MRKKHVAFSFYMLHTTCPNPEHRQWPVACTVRTIHWAGSNFNGSCFTWYETPSGIQNRRGGLRSHSFRKEAASPWYLILFPSDPEPNFYLKKGDFMEGLFKIPRLMFVFPKPFLWLPVIFFSPWGWSVQKHQVRKIRLSKLLKLLELTLCKGQNIYTWKTKAAIEWFPGPANTVRVFGSEGYKR